MTDSDRCLGATANRCSPTAGVTAGYRSVTDFISLGSRRMFSLQSLALVLVLLCIQVRSSSESPPKLGRCRQIHKAKQDYEEYTFPADYGTCNDVVILPIASSVVINVTDTRNCANYYKCKERSCEQCPCPEGETFNPETGSCDTTGALCACPTTTLEPTTTTSSTTTTTTRAPTTASKSQGGQTPPPPPVQTISGDGQGEEGADVSDRKDHQTGDTDGEEQKEERDSIISQEIIIIAGIVSVTIIIVVVIIMAVFLYQKGRINHNKKPPRKLPPSASSSQDGYSPAAAPSDRHVYAEIDERVIPSSKHWQHSGGSIRAAPPLPSHQPPIASSSVASSPCPQHQFGGHPTLHQQQVYSDSGMGSVTDNSFTTPTNFSYTPKAMLTQVKYINDGRPVALVHTCGCLSNDFYHNRDVSSLSDNYSCTNSVDSLQTDISHTPLHQQQPATTTTTAALCYPTTSPTDYMSQQVYI